MITPELKDRILSTIVDLGMECKTYTFDDCEDFDIDRDTYCAILDQFERRGFIRQNKMLGGFIFISVTADAHDFVRHGGFVAQEELLKSNIQKLGLEIDLLCKELTPDHLDRTHKIAAIGGSILSALGLMQ